MSSEGTWTDGERMACEFMLLDCGVDFERIVEATDIALHRAEFGFAW